MSKKKWAAVCNDSTHMWHRLKAACAEAGSQKAFAAKHGIMLIEVRRVMRGDHECTAKIARALGCKKLLGKDLYRVPISESHPL